jgi:hypothetical protein
MLDLETPRGLQKRVHEVSVRRVDGPVPPPKDA